MGPVSLWGQDSGRGACFPRAGQPPLPPLALPRVLPPPRGCIMAREPPSGSGQLLGTPADPQPGWRVWWLSGSSQLSSLALWLEGGQGVAPGSHAAASLHTRGTAARVARDGPAAGGGSVGAATRARCAFLEAESSARQPCPPRGTHSNSPAGPAAWRAATGSSLLDKCKGRTAATLRREARSPGGEMGSGRPAPAPPLPPALPGLGIPGPDPDRGSGKRRPSASPRAPSLFLVGFASPVTSGAPQSQDEGKCEWRGRKAAREQARGRGRPALGRELLPRAARTSGSSLCSRSVGR